MIHDPYDIIGSCCNSTFFFTWSNVGSPGQPGINGPSGISGPKGIKGDDGGIGRCGLQGSDLVVIYYI